MTATAPNTPSAAVQGDPQLSALVARARSATIIDALERTAARVPDKVGLVDDDGALTFSQLDRDANGVANSLRARGLRHGDRLAVLAHNSRGFVLAYLGAAKLGLVIVPINFMLGSQEVAFILGKARATALVVEDALLPVAAAALHTGGLKDQVSVRAVIGTAAPGWDDIDAWVAHADYDAPGVVLVGSDVLELLFTSGTESEPKGALLSHDSIIAQHTSCIVGGEMTDEDVEVHAMPLYHCAQLHCFLTVDLHLGATSVILPGADPARILEAVERHGATKLFCPPTVWIDLMRHSDWHRRDLSSLRKGYYGASGMPVEVLRELREELPNVRLFNFYGQTEIAPLATILGPEDQERKAGSAGKPAVNVKTIVVDDDGRPLPPGSIGEIVHRSPQLMTGYWDEPEKTAEAFRGGWFHSGDLGVFDDDGYLTVVDRKKDMIKTGGENVASREVEELLHTHPAVVEAAVFGVDHPRWIEAVVAAVVLREGAQVETEELRDHVRSRAAHFKAPKHVVVLDALPKNASGKILKRKLRHEYADVSRASAPPADTSTTRRAINA
jgi:fatty-acyl-CoA synthase